MMRSATWLVPGLLPCLSAALLALLAVPCCANGAPIAHAGNQLTPDTFDTEIATGSWLIEFYSPWCGHCKHFAPTWKEWPLPACDAREVDCAAFGDLCSSQGINAYPYILLYKDGVKTRQFQSDRTVEELEKFIAAYAPRNARSNGTTEEWQSQNEEGSSQPAMIIQAREVNMQGEVLVLDESTVEEAVTGNIGPTFIKFYAPWCSHCKAMAPAWAELAVELRGKINVAELDCDNSAHRAVCQKQGVRSFPTLHMFASGHRREYTGVRNVGSMRLFAEKAALSSGLQNLPADGLTAAQSTNDALFVYLKHGDISQDAIVDAAAASLFGSAPVYRSASKVFDASLIATDDPPTLVVYKKPFNEPIARRQLHLSDSFQAISEWMRDWRLPLVMELTSDSSRDLLEDGSSQRVLIVALPEVDRETAVTDVWALAEQWSAKGDGRGPTRFAWVRHELIRCTRDLLTQQAKAAAERLDKWLRNKYGIKSTKKATVILAEPNLMRYYKRDLEGSLLSLDQPLQIFEALEAHDRGKLGGVKHTLGRVERGALFVGRKLESFFIMVADHPFRSAFGLVGFVAVSFFILVRLLDGPPERPYEKKD